MKALLNKRIVIIFISIFLFGTKSGAAIKDYEDAIDYFNSGNYTEAIKRFEDIRNRYPFSRYARLSLLRIADSYFKQGNYQEAASSYSTYVELYPDSKEYEYALYRIGKSYQKDAPSNLWIFAPPPYERSLQSPKKAINIFKRYLNEFPHGRWSKDAKEGIEKMVALLIKKEIYSAQFYEKRKGYAGALFRYIHLLKRYPEYKTRIAKKISCDTKLLLSEDADGKEKLKEIKRTVKSMGLDVESLFKVNGDCG